jgi:hypothetical protein
VRNRSARGHHRTTAGVPDGDNPCWERLLAGGLLAGSAGDCSLSDINIRKQLTTKPELRAIARTARNRRHRSHKRTVSRVYRSVTTELYERAAAVNLLRLKVG